MITISAQLKERALEPVLARYAELFARLERLLFVALYVKAEPVAAAKRRVVAEHRITARVLPARNRTRHVWHNWRLWAKARQPHRRSSTQPKGSRGLQPPTGRSARFDPVSPNGRSGRADPVMPSQGASSNCGATPQASRESCSRGVIDHVWLPSVLTDRWS